MSNLRRSVLSAAAIGFAVLALGNAIDRMAERDPSLREHVPGFLSSHANRAEAAVALQDADYARARDAARRSIVADPFDWRAPGLLVAAEAGAGQTVAARKAVGLANRYGYRDALSRRFQAIDALRAGSLDKAALHIDVLLRITAPNQWPNDLVAALENSPEGGRALASRLSGKPGWGDRYLGGFGVEPLMLLRRAEWLAEAGMQPLGCDTVEPLVSAALDQSRRAVAQRAWNVHCPEGRVAGLVADSTFVSFPDGENRSPFGWARVPSGDLVVERSQGGLRLVSRASVARPALVQPVALRPGRYAIEFVAEGSGGRVLAGLTCTQPDRAAVVSSGEINAPDCDNQILSLWITPGQEAVRLQSVTLTAR